MDAEVGDLFGDVGCPPLVMWGPPLMMWGPPLMWGPSLVLGCLVAPLVRMPSSVVTLDAQLSGEDAPLSGGL